MSAEKDILEYLKKYKYGSHIKYKGVRVGFLGLPDFEYYKNQTLANKCSSLKTKGFIKEVNGNYFITYKGEDYLNKPIKKIFNKFTTNKSKNDPKDLLIIYDVPQDETTLRNWLRRQLKTFHFVMIQRSVWVGPSPLPRFFILYLNEVGLKNNIKTFKLEKGYKE